MKAIKEKIKYYIKEIFVFIVMITIISNAISIYRSQELTKTPLEIDSIKLINNQEYLIPKKKPILIHFWATWCPTCKLEASNIEFLSKYFEVITIAVKSGSDQKISKYLKKRGYHFKVYNDKDAKIAAKFHVFAFPTTFIYNKEHKLLFSEVGYSSTIGLYLRLLWAKFNY